MSRLLLQWINEQSPAATPTGPWEFLPPSRNIRDLPLNDPAFVGELCEEFSPEELMDARMLVASADEAPKLNPILSGKGRRVLFLRRSQEQTPFDIISENGSLLSGDPPGFRCIEDAFNERAMCGFPSVLVAASISDLLIARSLGLPCTPAAGLATMNGIQSQRLFRDAMKLSAGRCHPREPHAWEEKSHCPVLVGWKITQLKNELPSAIVAVIKRLLQSANAYGHDWLRCLQVWQPSPQEFSRIRDAVELQDQDRVGQLFCQSIERELQFERPLSDAIASDHSTDYLTAHRDLRQALESARKFGFRLSDLEAKLDAFDRSFYDSMFDPSIRAVTSKSEPIVCGLLISAAELMRQNHSSSLLSVWARNSIGAQRYVREPVFTTEQQQVQNRMVDAIAKISRELNRHA